MRYRVGTTILMLCALVAIRPAEAQPAKITVGLPSLSMFTVVHHVAVDRGYYEKEGVQVELSHFESGSINMKALLARAIDVSDVETALILGAAGTGADLRVIGTHAQGLHFALYAKKEIGGLPALAGRTFAISGIGGLPHVVILALLERQRLDPARVQMVAVGGTGARLKALAAGKVDATLGEYSPVIEADPNLHRLMIISRELPLYMAQGLAVWADTLPAKRDALERFQRGLIRATRWVYESKAEFVTAARKHLPASVEDLGKVYDFYVQARVWSINGELDPQRLAYMQELGLKTKTQGQPVDLKRLGATATLDRVIEQVGRRDYPPAR